MRLIDADKLLEDLKQKRYSKRSLELIQSQLVVEAIPIEFLDKWFGNNYNAFTDLMTAWEKENGVN